LNKKFIIVLANDMGYRGMSIGPISKKRCEVGLRAMVKTDDSWEHSYIITSAGMANARKFDAQRLSFGEMQRQHILTCAKRHGAVNEKMLPGNFGNHVLTPQKHECYWSTRAEIMSALRIISKKVNEGEQADVQIITSSYHAFRTEFIWNNELKRLQTWNAERITSCEITTISDRNMLARLLEPVKIVIDFLRNFKKRRTWNNVQPTLSPF